MFGKHGPKLDQAKPLPRKRKKSMSLVPLGVRIFLVCINKSLLGSMFLFR